jgi:hypothetical protein
MTDLNANGGHDSHVKAARWLESAALLAQGGYWTVTGVWPLVHMKSFLAVTGPKTDLWLVQTVGSLIAVIGVALLIARRRARGGGVSAEAAFLAIAGAAALAAVDVTFVSLRMISPVYLLDAAAEAVIILMWAAVLILGARGRDRTLSQRHLARQVFS